MRFAERHARACPAQWRKPFREEGPYGNVGPAFAAGLSVGLPFA